MPLSTTRPPTPPKKNGSTAATIANQSNCIVHVPPGSLLQTPDTSPSSSAGGFSASLDKPSKRVGFSPWTEFFKATDHNDKVPSSSSSSSHKPIRPVPPSKECKSSKSILKPLEHSASEDKGTRPSTVDSHTFPTMLDEVTRELMSRSESSRLDAYMTLNGCLKAFDEVPDFLAMSAKMTLLTQCIRRDLCASPVDTRSTQTQLRAQAIKLLTVFLFRSSLNDLLDDEFCTFVVDHSTSVLEKHGLPKILVICYLQVLATQNFPLKVMSSNRVDRLLDVLDQITDHAKGSSIVGQRLMIYRRLLTQAPPSVASRASDWVDHLFSGMLSSVKEIRVHAIAFGVEASLRLGTVSSVSRAVQEIFKRESPEGKKFVDLLETRLHEILSTKNEGHHVPQIWSIVVLFFRSRRHQLEQWDLLRRWLGIMQGCFNSADLHIKLQANIAWNRFIFAVGLDVSTCQSMVRMLRQPLITQLSRKQRDKQPKSERQIAISSYCTLLYYAFPPTADHSQVERYWDEYILPLCSSNLLGNEIGIKSVCQIMTALLGDTQRNPWAQDRVNESEPIRPDDLPRLDTKWSRSRAIPILKLLESIFLNANWSDQGQFDDSILPVWQSFCEALRDAGSKEVKVSSDCMAAVACITGTLDYLWVENCSKSKAMTMRFLSRFLTMIDSAVAILGLTPLMEKRLIRSPDRSFQVAETLCDRQSLRRDQPCSVIFHLLVSLVSSVPENCVDNVFRISVETLIEFLLRSTSSSESKMETLCDLAQLSASDNTGKPKARASMWLVIVDSASDLICLLKSSANIDGIHRFVDPGYSNVVKILEAGLRHHTNDHAHIWTVSLAKTVQEIRKNFPAAASLAPVLEPVAECLKTISDDNFHLNQLSYSTALVRHASWPNSSCGANTLQNASLPSPYTHLCSLVDAHLLAAYIKLNSSTIDYLTPFVDAVSKFMFSCPTSFQVEMLGGLKGSLSIWIEDAEDKLKPSGSRMNALASKLWMSTARVLEGFSSLCDMLPAVDMLLLSSLKSRNQTVVSRATEFWERALRKEDILAYSEPIRAGLVHLRQPMPICVTDSKLSHRRIQNEPDTPSSIDPENEQEAMLANSSSAGLDIARTPRTLPTNNSNQTNQSPLVAVPKETSKRQALNGKAVESRSRGLETFSPAFEPSFTTNDGTSSMLLADLQGESRQCRDLDSFIVHPDETRNATSSFHYASDRSPGLPSRPDSHSTSLFLNEVPSSPIVALRGSPTEAFVESSPTPNSHRNRLETLVIENELPSSPPEIPQKQTRRNTFIPLAPVNCETCDSHETSLSGERKQTEWSQTMSASDKAIPTNEDSHLVEHAEQTSDDLNHQKHLSRTEIPHEALSNSKNRGLNVPEELEQILDEHTISWSQESDDEHHSTATSQDSVMSDTAAQSPQIFYHVSDAGESSPNPADDDNINIQPSNLQGELQTPCLEEEDEVDKVWEQIANDMELALSQDSQKLETIQQVPLELIEEPRSGRKRKRKSSDSAEVTRNLRSRNNKRVVEVVVERRQPSPSEEIRDCIVVAPPTSGELSCPPKQPPARDRVSSSSSHTRRLRSTESFTSLSYPTVEDATMTISASGQDEREAIDSHSIEVLSSDRLETPDLKSNPSRNYSNTNERELEAMVITKAGTTETASQAQCRHTLTSPQRSPQVPPVRCVVESQAEMGATRVALDATGPTQAVASASEFEQQESRGGRSLLQELKRLLAEAKDVVLEPAEGREVITAWMDLGKELHEAQHRV